MGSAYTIQRIEFRVLEIKLEFKKLIHTVHVQYRCMYSIGTRNNPFPPVDIIKTVDSLSSPQVCFLTTKQQRVVAFHKKILKQQRHDIL